MSTISVANITGIANVTANSVAVGSHVINTSAVSFSTDISVNSLALSSSHASLRANRNITGGGNITFDGSGNFKWTSRFIVIANGSGSYFSTNGYFDINMPATNAVITGVGGASNQTVTSSGIPINAWTALYYILPIGSNNGSLDANFRLVGYGSAFIVPDNWVLIALRNDDSVILYVNNGISIRAGVTPSNVVQTVYNRYDGKTAYSFATAGQTGSFITDLSTSITPRFSSNRILINFCPTFECQNDTVFKLYRNINGAGDVDIATNVNDANYWSGWGMPGYDADNASTPRTNSHWFLDSPNTTSPITYKFMIQSGGIGATTLWLNRSVNSAGQQNYEVGISQVILQEIGL